jgi:alginate O-acetyltransferase complex protein AlgJ
MPTQSNRSDRDGQQGSGRGGPTDPSHDEDLRRGIIRTRLSRRTGWLLALGFLAVIYGIPLVQGAVDVANDEQIVLLALFRRAPTRDNLKQLEQDVDNSSLFRGWVQPRLQEWLTKQGRVGNKKAIVGRDGWLYYQPGVAFLGGPPFLDHDTIEARRRTARLEAGEEVHPDPRPAILAFARTLAARGIKLILVPVPDKAMLHPSELHGRWANEPTTPPRNPDFDRWKREMEAAGVLVFDATPAVLRPGEPPRFLVQDTHWTPAFMQATANDLASFVRTRIHLPEVAAPKLRIERAAVTRVGDIVDMLKLTDGQQVFAPQTATIERVLTAEGGNLEPDASADVLLLGDSFTNIFTQAPMGWGESAGFGPHLQRALGRPVDVIAQNDAGAFATRQLLARALAAGSDRLAGKRVVIWEFAARELGVGDWKPVAWGK